MPRSKAEVFREALEVLERLEVADGPLARESLLEAYQDNPALRTIIKMSIGTDRYYVRPSMNIICTSRLSDAQSWRRFRELTGQLKNRELTGNAAKNAVNSFLAACRPGLMKWYCRIFNHDLRCGVNVKTVQKTWGRKFLLADSAVGTRWHYNGCALAKKHADVYRKKKPVFPLALESKYDGERANLICFPRDDEVFVLTRTGRRRKQVEEVGQWRQQVLDFCRALNGSTTPDRPLFLDGEFLARSRNEAGLVRRTKTFSPELFLQKVRLILWDWAPLDRYLAGSFDMNWMRRKSELLHAAGAIRPTARLKRFTRNVWIAGHSMVYDEAQLWTEYNQRLDAGHEGVVLKNPDAAYVPKRSKDLVKLKPENTRSGRIIEVVAGKGQHGPVAAPVRGKLKRSMEQCGQVKETEQYLHCKTEDTDHLVEVLRGQLHGDGERRVSCYQKGVVSLRHGPRLGYLVVELKNGDYVRVGGGFTHKAGNDQRAWFWRKRDEVLGMWIDFKESAETTVDAVTLYPRFVRIREDLS